MSDAQGKKRLLCINTLIGKHIKTDIPRDNQAALGAVYGKQ